MTQHKERIGFVGVGLMGHGMAKNILAKGWPLQVIANRNRVPVDDLVSKGASEAKSYAEMAGSCDIIFLCVTSSIEVEQVVLGEEGLAVSGKPGLVIVDTSTSHPDSTRKINQQLRADGMLFCDAPLSRSPQRAEQGELACLVAAEAKLFERIKPVIDAYSEQIIHAGETIGVAHQVKLMNNFVALGFASVWSEAYATCVHAGIAPQVLYDFLSGSGLNCTNFQNFSKYILHQDPTGQKFTIANAAKDLRYYTQYVDGMQLGSAVADSVFNNLKIAVRNGYQDRFVPELTAAVMENNNVKRT